MVYERFVKQLDGCTYHTGGDNCNCAAGAMWLYRASQGRVATTSCDVRRRTGDTSGGTNLEQIEQVAHQYGLTGGKIYKPIPFDQLVKLIQTGRYGAILQIDYSPIAPTKYDCFDSRFLGGHSIYLSTADVDSIRGGDPGADGRRDTIPRGYQDYPISLLKKAAGMLDLGNGDTVDSESGPGHAWAYLTPADPLPARYRATIVGYTRLYSRPGGTVVGAVTKATYICSRSKVDGLWWYTILTKSDGSPTASRGRAFKPTSVTHITRI